MPVRRPSEVAQRRPGLSASSASPIACATKPSANASAAVLMGAKRCQKNAHATPAQANAISATTARAEAG